MWDERYAGEGYFYGTEPNDFLREHAATIPSGGRVLCLAEGEGRNAVFLAERGFSVVALDQSAVGLRKALQLDRRITLREILAKAFGDIDRFKTKDELLEEELAKFVSIHKPDAVQMPTIRQFFKAYVTDGAVRTIVDSREFGRLADNPKVSLADVRALGQWHEVIPEYVKDYVSLNQFV